MFGETGACCRFANFRAIWHLASFYSRLPQDCEPKSWILLVKCRRGCPARKG